MVATFPVNPVLLVDDDESWLKSLSVLLKRKAGISNVITCSASSEVMPIINSRAVSIVLLDYSMPGITGDRVLLNIKNDFPDIPVILLTGHDQVDIVVKCMQLGAFDYFVKTHETERILSGIQKAIRLHEVMHENRLLSSGFLNDSGPRRGDAFSGLWTRSFRMLRIFQYLEAVAESSVPVLLIGEQGTGKTTLAKALHSSGGKSENFVHCEIAEHGDFLPDALCGRKSAGLLEQAEGGTLYLDGIEHLSRVGEDFLSELIDSPLYASGSGGRSRWFTGRIVASAGVPLDSITGMKRLLMKFSSHSIQIPALRQRREDLPVLVDCFLDEAAQHLMKSRPTPPPELFSLLGTYIFPGNILELREMVFEAVRAHSFGVLSLDAFRSKISETVQDEASTAMVQFAGSRLPTLSEVQDILIQEASRRASGNQGLMADMLGISRTAINKRLKKAVVE